MILPVHLSIITLLGMVGTAAAADLNLCPMWLYGSIHDQVDEAWDASCREHPEMCNGLWSGTLKTVAISPTAQEANMGAYYANFVFELVSCARSTNESMRGGICTDSGAAHGNVTRPGHGTTSEFFTDGDDAEVYNFLMKATTTGRYANPDDAGGLVTSKGVTWYSVSCQQDTPPSDLTSPHAVRLTLEPQCCGPPNGPRVSHKPDSQVCDTPSNPHVPRNPPTPTTCNSDGGTNINAADNRFTGGTAQSSWELMCYEHILSTEVFEMVFTLHPTLQQLGLVAASAPHVKSGCGFSKSNSHLVGTLYPGSEGRIPGWIQDRNQLLQTYTLIILVIDIGIYGFYILAFFMIIYSQSQDDVEVDAGSTSPPPGGQRPGADVNMINAAAAPLLDTKMASPPMCAISCCYPYYFCRRWCCDFKRKAGSCSKHFKIGPSYALFGLCISPPDYFPDQMTVEEAQTPGAYALKQNEGEEEGKGDADHINELQKKSSFWRCDMANEHLTRCRSGWFLFAILSGAWYCAGTLFCLSFRDWFLGAIVLPVLGEKWPCNPFVESSWTNIYEDGLLFNKDGAPLCTLRKDGVLFRNLFMQGNGDDASQISEDYGGCSPTNLLTLYAMFLTTVIMSLCWYFGDMALAVFVKLDPATAIARDSQGKAWQSTTQNTRQRLGHGWNTRGLPTLSDSSPRTHATELLKWMKKLRAWRRHKTMIGRRGHDSNANHVDVMCRSEWCPDGCFATKCRVPGCRCNRVSSTGNATQPPQYCKCAHDGTVIIYAPKWGYKHEIDCAKPNPCCTKRETTSKEGEKRAKIITALITCCSCGVFKKDGHRCGVAFLSLQFGMMYFLICVACMWLVLASSPQSIQRTPSTFLLWVKSSFFSLLFGLMDSEVGTDMTPQWTWPLAHKITLFFKAPFDLENTLGMSDDGFFGLLIATIIALELGQAVIGAFGVTWPSPAFGARESDRDRHKHLQRLHYGEVVPEGDSDEGGTAASKEPSGIGSGASAGSPPPRLARQSSAGDDGESSEQTKGTFRGTGYVRDSCLLIACHKSCITPGETATFQATLRSALAMFHPEDIFVCDNHRDHEGDSTEGDSIEPADSTEEVCFHVDPKINYVFIPEGNKTVAFWYTSAVYIPRKFTDHEQRFKYCVMIDDDVALPPHLDIPYAQLEDDTLNVQAVCYPISALENPRDELYKGNTMKLHGCATFPEDMMIWEGEFEGEQHFKLKGIVSCFRELDGVKVELIEVDRTTGHWTVKVAESRSRTVEGEDDWWQFTIRRVEPFFLRPTHRNLLVELQDIEYKTSGFVKQLQSKSGSTLWCHGAIALWKRGPFKVYTPESWAQSVSGDFECLQEETERERKRNERRTHEDPHSGVLHRILEQHNTEFNGEDMYMGVQLHRIANRISKPYRIIVQANAAVPTYPPEDIFTLWKQRVASWDIGAVSTCTERVKDLFCLFSWRDCSTICLKPYLLLELIYNVFDWLRLFLLFSFAVRNPVGLFVVVFAFHVMLWIELAILNAVIMQRRPDLRFSSRAILFFPLYRAMSMMFRLFAHLRYFLLPRKWAKPTILERRTSQKDLPPPLSTFAIKALAARARERDDALKQNKTNAFFTPPAASSSPRTWPGESSWATVWGKREDADVLHNRTRTSTLQINRVNSVGSPLGLAAAAAGN